MLLHAGMVCVWPYLNLLYRANGLDDAQIGVLAGEALEVGGQCACVCGGGGALQIGVSHGKHSGAELLDGASPSRNRCCLDLMAAGVLVVVLVVVGSRGILVVVLVVVGGRASPAAHPQYITGSAACGTSWRRILHTVHIAAGAVTAALL